jgi:hypothetical protein
VGCASGLGWLAPGTAGSDPVESLLKNLAGAVSAGPDLISGG